MIEVLSKLTTIRPLLAVVLAGILLFAAMTVLLLTTRKKPVKIVSAITLVLITALVAGTLSIYVTAKSHGATDEHLQEMTIKEVVTRTLHSHRQSKLTEDTIGNLKDCYILYFKFGCDDCLETYDGLQKFLKENDPGTPVYYISTESEIGRKLLWKYGIAEVPGLVYIYPNGTTFLGKTLYYKDRDTDRAVFDGDAALELYRFRQDVLSANES